MAIPGPESVLLLELGDSLGLGGYGAASSNRRAVAAAASGVKRRNTPRNESRTNPSSIATTAGTPLTSRLEQRQVAAVFFFPRGGDDEKVRGSSFGQPDGSEHMVEVLEGNGRLIVRVDSSHNDDEPLDLLLEGEQALDIYHAVGDVLTRIGLSERK